MYLRAVIHMNQNNFDRAKEFFLKAVQVDARCYQAYDQLITNNLLDPDEGNNPGDLANWKELALLNNLDFKGIPTDCRDFIRLLYLTKLNKVISQRNLADYSTNIPISSRKPNEYYKTHLD